MKKKKYLQGITFFVEPGMYGEMRKISDKREISLSEFIRELIQNYFKAANDAVANPGDDAGLSIVE
ncbi:MAG: hypothetical protein ABSH41_06980 [Syntrophobacteraceae bacterium]